MHATSPRLPLAEPEARLASAEDHAAGVREMFGRIAPTYDTLNRVLSAGVDVRWRKRAIESLSGRPAGSILDSCAGTMDLTAMLVARWPGDRVVAADFAAEMLEAGKHKAPGAERVVADAMALPFEAASFAAVICGFGMRNLSDTRRGIAEAKRVLVPGGIFATLEFFRPTRTTTRLFHGVYGNLVLPTVGGLVSGDRSAYAYLTKSMQAFATLEQYVALCEAEGLRVTRTEDLTFGIASLVVAEAP